MSRFTAQRLQAIRSRHGADAIRVFVETGTFHGATTRLALAVFPVVHTIELQPEWYAEAARDLSPLGAICHQGNSAIVVPQLAKSITEPVFWFLDAHYFKLVPGVAGEAEGLPLWDELAAIAERSYRDVIAVDDVNDFGTSAPTPEWVDVSLARIAGYFPDARAAAVLWDQAVVWR